MPHTLTLWRQQMGKVPASVWQRTELQVLILADNGLTHLPTEIGELQQLTTLDLGHNHLRSVPGELGALTNQLRRQEPAFRTPHDDPNETTWPDDLHPLGRLTPNARLADPC
ncbi:hypothetical protein [Streptomyces sp. NPDC101165]|uniref:hypothetical protein n=1 Tax=Streptomyces sp. NPDC101165 TaxID=3366119 RepID=UPI0038257F53